MRERERRKNETRRSKRAEGGEAARGVSLARHKKIFEYDYTARVNRPVRKRAASYTRNAFTWPDGGAVGGPRGPGKRRGDPAPREETVRLEEALVGVHVKVSPFPPRRARKRGTRYRASYLPPSRSKLHRNI